MSEDPEVLFREVQTFLPWDTLWNWVLVGGGAAIFLVLAAGLAISWLRRGPGWPKHRVLTIGALVTAGILAIVLPILAMLVLPTLTIEVHQQEVTAQLWPFQSEPEHIPLSWIQNQYVRRYNPVGEFGGWGIRQGRGGARAYNARGNVGVQLVYNTGGQMLLGSQRAEELAEAIRLARSQLPSGGPINPYAPPAP